MFAISITNKISYFCTAQSSRPDKMIESWLHAVIIHLADISLTERKRKVALLKSSKISVYFYSIYSRRRFVCRGSKYSKWSVERCQQSCGWAGGRGQAGLAATSTPSLPASSTCCYTRTSLYCGGHHPRPRPPAQPGQQPLLAGQGRPTLRLD